MRVIGIDTSTSAGGVALSEGGVVIADYTLQLTATHSERLMPALQRVMADAGWSRACVDAIAVATGPGSFTGLRIGVATAKALAYSWQIPVVGVTTLEALAWQVSWAGPVIVPMVDARRRTVYAQVFERSTDSDADGDAAGLHAVTEPEQLPLDQLLMRLEKMYQDISVVVVGDGAVRNRQALEPALRAGKLLLPVGFGAVLHAAAVAELGAVHLQSGHRDDPMQLVPLYLRKSEAEIRWETRHQMSRL